MRSQFRNANEGESQLITEAIEVFYKDRSSALAQFIIMWGFMGLLCVLSIASQVVFVCNGIEFFLATLLVSIGVLITIYLVVKKRYRNKVECMKRGGYQVITGDMISKEEVRTRNECRLSISIISDESFLQEETIMPVEEKEIICTKVGKRQMNAYEPFKKALVVKYNSGSGFWDQYDCIPFNDKMKAVIKDNQF